MDTLHAVLRSIRSDTRGDHLSVFREFLDHLDRAGRRPRHRPSVRGIKAQRSRRRRRTRGKN